MPESGWATRREKAGKWLKNGSFQGMGFAFGWAAASRSSCRCFELCSSSSNSSTNVITAAVNIYRVYRLRFVLFPARLVRWGRESASRQDGERGLAKEQRISQYRIRVFNMRRVHRSTMPRIIGRFFCGAVLQRPTDPHASHAHSGIKCDQTARRSSDTDKAEYKLLRFE